jgi:hypothetical protein
MLLQSLPYEVLSDINSYLDVGTLGQVSRSVKDTGSKLISFEQYADPVCDEDSKLLSRKLSVLKNLSWLEWWHYPKHSGCSSFLLELSSETSSAAELLGYVESWDRVSDLEKQSFTDWIYQQKRSIAVVTEGFAVSGHEVQTMSA